MRRRFILWGILAPFCAAAQDYFSYGTINHAGVLNVYSNPALIAGSRLKIDVTPIGYDLHFNNSWFGIRKDALKYEGSVFQPSKMKFSPSWKNTVPGVPDNYFKNFNWKNFTDSRSLIFEERVFYPSAMYSIDPRQAIAFSWSVRQVVSLEGIENGLARLFENEFDLSVMQNNRVTNARLRSLQVSWAEYAITYARSIIDNRHYLAAGITPKLLQGYRSGIMELNQLDFYFSNTDNSSYFNSEIIVARSPGINSPFQVQGALTGIRRPSQLFPALEFGMVYEWRPKPEARKPKPEKSPTEKPEDKSQRKKFRWHIVPYTVKAGLSVVDVGRLRFKKDEDYYHLNISLSEEDIIRYSAVTSFRTLDSLLNVDFPKNTGPSGFDVNLPTAVNAQADVRAHQFVYVNLSGHFPAGRSDVLRARTYRAICFAPRFQSNWIDVSLPFTWHELSAKRGEQVMMGVNLRLGVLLIGSRNLSALFRNDVGMMDFYAILKVPILY